ncbi:MAG: AtpZ/AtpI family protein [Chitinophagia bacterium]|nr:AtpZ/AtpI family protein [Chitinophagia bacterium]
MKNDSSPTTAWAKYLGLGGQIFGSTLLMLAVGWKLDKWLGITSSLFIWVLPLLMIILILVKIVLDTNKKTK